MKKFTLLLATMLLSVMSYAEWKRVTTVAELLEGGTMIIGYETAKSGTIVPMRAEGTATTTDAGYIYSGTTAGNSTNGTIDMSNLSESVAYELTILPSTSVSGAICIKIGDNYLGNTNTKNDCKLFTAESANTAFTPTLGTNGVCTLKIAANTGNKTNYTTLQYNTGSPRFAVYSGTQKNVVIYKKIESTATLQSIEIAGEPTKTTYMAGDAFSTDGLKVMGNYDNATQKEITTGITWEVTPAPLTAGLTQVKVKATVGDFSADTTITNLTVTAPKTLTSIAVSGIPADFWKGDTFHHDGMTVTANWDDNSTTDVTAEATFSTPDMTTAGEKTITVTYKEKTATYDITVKTIANTQETAYTVAEAIALIDAGKDLSTEVFVKGIVSEIVTPWSDQFKNITYNISDDGTTTSAQFQLFRCVTNGANVGDAVIAKGVMKKYGTTYQLNAGNTIVAIVEKVVTGIAISGEASKTTYYAGQTFNPEGLVVTATFDDKSTANVTGLVDWTFAPAVLEEGMTTVSVSATYKERNAAPVVVTVTVGPTLKTDTIYLSKDETTKAKEDTLEWKRTVITVTAAKGEASTNTNNYYPGTSGQSYKSTRFYNGSTLTFTPVKGITLVSITYTATTDNYATAMANSTWTNASTSTSGQTVTITPTDGEKAVSAKIGGTTGGTSFVINYSGEASATAIDSAAVETPALKTIENGQLIILRDGVKYNAMGVRLQ